MQRVKYCPSDDTHNRTACMTSSLDGSLKTSWPGMSGKMLGSDTLVDSVGRPLLIRILNLGQHNTYDRPPFVLLFHPMTNTFVTIT